MTTVIALVPVLVVEIPGGIGELDDTMLDNTRPRRDRTNYKRRLVGFNDETDTHEGKS